MRHLIKSVSNSLVQRNKTSSPLEVIATSRLPSSSSGIEDEEYKMGKEDREGIPATSSVDSETEGATG